MNSTRTDEEPTRGRRELRLHGRGPLFHHALVKYCQQNHLEVRTRRLVGFPHFTEEVTVWGSRERLLEFVDWIDNRFPKYRLGGPLRADLYAIENGRNPYHVD